MQKGNEKKPTITSGIFKMACGVAVGMLTQYLIWTYFPTTTPIAQGFAHMGGGYLWFTGLMEVLNHAKETKRQSRSD